MFYGAATNQSMQPFPISAPPQAVAPVSNTFNIANVANVIEFKPAAKK
jgi:hypothetical protein